jgi:hypothetical protein
MKTVYRIAFEFWHKRKNVLIKDYWSFEEEEISREYLNTLLDYVNITRCGVDPVKNGMSDIMLSKYTGVPPSDLCNIHDFKIIGYHKLEVEDDWVCCTN